MIADWNVSAENAVAYVCAVPVLIVWLICHTRLRLAGKTWWGNEDDEDV